MTQSQGKQVMTPTRERSGLSRQEIVKSMDMTTIRAPMEVDHLPEKLKAMRQRVRALYRKGGPSIHHDGVLSEAFEELAIALEELCAADEARHHQHEAWLDERTALEAEIGRYQELFDQAPIGYLLTSLDGSIRQANSTAAAMLGAERRLLAGRSLALFIPEGQRRPFRAEVARLRDAQHLYIWEAEIRPWQGAPFAAEFMVTVARGEKGLPRALRWLMHDISQRKQEEQQLRSRIAELEQRLRLFEGQPAREREVGAD
jgi:PAS domain S-box-containing protein